MTLNEVMKETADAIREKKGTTDLIAPVNFAEEIRGISAGGGGSGESEFFMKYYDIDAMWSALGTVSKETYIFNIKGLAGPLVPIVAKLYFPDYNMHGIFVLDSNLDLGNVNKLGFLYGVTLVEGDASMKITPEFVSEVLHEYPIDQYEITKEEFYDLNA